MSKERFNPAIKLLKRPDLLLDLQNEGMTSGPALVEISPTNKCNAKCGFCFYSGDHSRDSLDLDVLLNALTDLQGLGTLAINWTGGGDPSIYEHLAEAVSYASGLGLKQGIFTNGYSSKLMPSDVSVFDWIRVSMTPEYMSTRVAESISKYTARNGNVGVVLNQVPGESEELIRELATLSKLLGARYFQVRPALAAPGMEQPVLSPARLDDLCTKDFVSFNNEYKWAHYLDDPEASRGYSVCLGGWITPTLWFNGDLRVCNYRGEENFVVGNVNDTSLDDLWYSDRAKEVFAVCDSEFSQCQRLCKPNEINKVLYDILLREIPDKEFV